MTVKESPPVIISCIQLYGLNKSNDQFEGYWPLTSHVNHPLIIKRSIWKRVVTNHYIKFFDE